MYTSKLMEKDGTKSKGQNYSSSEDDNNIIPTKEQKNQIASLLGLPIASSKMNQ